MIQSSTLECQLKDEVTPSAIRHLAAMGYTTRLIAGKLGLSETDFNQRLKQNTLLEKALERGRVDAEASIHDSLWKLRDKDRGILLLLARLHLKLDDPIVDRLAGGMLELALKKTDRKSKETLSKALGLK